MENDTKNKIKNITEGLLLEEEAENTLISLYISLLDLGVENCVSETERDGFRKGMDILYGESVKHKEIIINLLNKYKSS